MSTNTTAQLNGQEGSVGSSRGKAPDGGETQIGFRPQTNMSVQPPRQEDLQKSYASIVGDEANPKGWYGTMGLFILYAPIIFPLHFELGLYQIKCLIVHHK